MFYVVHTISILFFFSLRDSLPPEKKFMRYVCKEVVNILSFFSLGTPLYVRMGDIKRNWTFHMHSTVLQNHCVYWYFCTSSSVPK